MYLTTMQHDGTEWRVHLWGFPRALHEGGLRFEFIPAQGSPADARTCEMSADDLRGLRARGGELGEPLLRQHLTRLLRDEPDAKTVYGCGPEHERTTGVIDAR